MKRPAPALRTAQAIERLQEEVQVSLRMSRWPSARRPRLPLGFQTDAAITAEGSSRCTAARRPQLGNSIATLSAQ